MLALVFLWALVQANLLAEKWGEAWPFQGISTFAHLETHQCLLSPEVPYDIAIIGVPFDTATSYRSGARFGPRAIRAASLRQTSLRGYNHRAKFNPYKSWAKIVDCGDIPVTPMDNALAFRQMNIAFEELVAPREASKDSGEEKRTGPKMKYDKGNVVQITAGDSRETTKSKYPRYIALGGDHLVLLPHLRALHKIYGPLNIIHFDAHLDTWKPDKYPSVWHTPQSELNHGSMLWQAHEEGLTSLHNIHVGVRTRLSGTEDLEDDEEQNFVRVFADDIWLEGAQSVAEKILSTIPKDSPTYISVDIDVLDPGFASGTGTIEPGGLLPRELIYLLRKIEALSVVGADVVEVSPQFDSAEVTATNAAQVAFELLTSMVKKGPLEFSSE